MLPILACHELMLTGRLTVEYDAELYRVQFDRGMPRLPEEAKPTMGGKNEAGRAIEHEAEEQWKNRKIFK
jgi:hypothetical protein